MLSVLLAAYSSVVPHARLVPIRLFRSTVKNVSEFKLTTQKAITVRAVMISLDSIKMNCKSVYSV